MYVFIVHASEWGFDTLIDRPTQIQNTYDVLVYLICRTLKYNFYGGRQLSGPIFSPFFFLLRKKTKQNKTNPPKLFFFYVYDTKYIYFFMQERKGAIPTQKTMFLGKLVLSMIYLPVLPLACPKVYHSSSSSKGKLMLLFYFSYHVIINTMIV